jgi:UDP-GlcNAc:undecaprenyl-phosphate GlcNAc-1-phosphate transferase
MLALLIAFCATTLFTPAVIYVAKRTGLVTDPTLRSHPAHTHEGPIPRAGGVAVLFGIAVAVAATITIHKLLAAILLAALILVVTGVVDDRFDLSPYLRLGLNLVAAVVAIAGGLGIPYVSNPFGPPVSLTEYQLVISFFGTRSILLIADALALVWLVALMNIVNWSKGVDGQLPGYTAVAALFLAILAGRFSSHSIAASDTQLLGLAVSGAFFGFLPWNFYPQRIMPGYGGGTLAGFMLGVLSILAFGKIGALMIVLAMPLLDGVYTIFRRLKNKKSPFRGDARHLHHLLLSIGWGKRRIALFYMGVTLILGGVALFLPNSIMKFMFIVVIYTLLAGWIYYLNNFTRE